MLDTRGEQSMTTLYSIDSSRLGKPSRPIQVANLDAQSLEAELRKRVQGEVRFDDGSRGAPLWGARPGPWWRHQPVRAVLQCRGRPRFLEVHARYRGARPGPETRPRAAGVCPRLPPRCG